jgi:hypothetical protein
MHTFRRRVAIVFALVSATKRSAVWSKDYILSAPSRQRNARWYGARLPDFMHETAPWRANRGAIDLARFERALSDAFDAADAPLSSIDALADICAEDWPRIAFEFDPSLTLLDLAGGTAQIYAALAVEEESTASGTCANFCLLIWRITCENPSISKQGCANAAGYSGRWANLCEPNSRRITSSVRSDLIYDRDNWNAAEPDYSRSAILRAPGAPASVT